VFSNKLSGSSDSWDESRIWFLFGLVSSRVMGLASWQWWELCWYELDIGDALFNGFIPPAVEND
jgi:hypothetical protein